MIDVNTIATVVSSGTAVITVYFLARSSIRKDHRDREREDAKQRREEIAAAIKAERERQALEDALAEIEDLKRHPPGD